MSRFKKKKPFGKEAGQPSSGTKSFGGRKRRGGGGGRRAEFGKRQKRDEMKAAMDEEIESDSSGGEEENLHTRQPAKKSATQAAFEDQSGEDEDMLPLKKRPKRKEEVKSVTLRDIASHIHLSPTTASTTAGEAQDCRLVTYRPHRLPPTCVRVSTDGRHVVSVSKDGSIVKCERLWD